jgi:hypothetical protein
VSEGAAREQARIDGTNLDDETDTEPESFESLLERMKSEEARTKSGGRCASMAAWRWRGRKRRRRWRCIEAHSVRCARWCAALCHGGD